MRGRHAFSQGPSAGGGAHSLASRSPHPHKEGEKYSKVCCIKHVTVTGLSQGGFLEVGAWGGPEMHLKDLRKEEPSHGHTGFSLEAGPDTPQDGPRTQGRDSRCRPQKYLLSAHRTQTDGGPRDGGPPQAFPDGRLASIKPC